MTKRIHYAWVIAGVTFLVLLITAGVRATPGVQLSEPVIETVVETALPDSTNLLIMGMDTGSDLKLYQGEFDQSGLEISNPLAFTSRPDSIAISRPFADRYGLKEGDHLPFYTESWHTTAMPAAEIPSRRVAPPLTHAGAGVHLSAIQFRRIRGGKIDMSVKAAIAAIGTNERLFPKWRVLVRRTKSVQSDHPVNA